MVSIQRCVSKSKMPCLQHQQWKFLLLKCQQKYQLKLQANKEQIQNNCKKVREFSRTFFVSLYITM